MAETEKVTAVVPRDPRIRIALEYPTSLWRELVDGLTAEELSATPNSAMLTVRDDLREQLYPHIGAW